LAGFLKPKRERNSFEKSAGASKQGASSSKDRSKGKEKAINNRSKYNHSKIATDICKEWFYAHMRHPFPSDDVKAEFADRTGTPIVTARIVASLSEPS